MALGKQQFFFPFFLFANSRYILLGSLYTSYDLLSPLNGQSYPIKIIQCGFWEEQEKPFQGHTVCIQSAGGALAFLWQVEEVKPQPQSIPLAEHPSGRTSFLPLSSSSGLQIKDCGQYSQGLGPLITPHTLLPKRILCCESRVLGAAPLKMGLYRNEGRP